MISDPQVGLAELRAVRERLAAALQGPTAQTSPGELYDAMRVSRELTARGMGAALQTRNAPERSAATTDSFSAVIFKQYAALDAIDAFAKSLDLMLSDYTAMVSE